MYLHKENKSIQTDPVRFETLTMKHQTKWCSYFINLTKTLTIVNNIKIKKIIWGIYSLEDFVTRPFHIKSIIKNRNHYIRKLYFKILKKALKLCLIQLLSYWFLQCLIQFTYWLIGIQNWTLVLQLITEIIYQSSMIQQYIYKA